MRRLGPALVGVLVLLAVAALATLGLRWVRHQRGLREKLTARDAIHAQVRGIILNQGVLKMAARFGGSSGNQELARCILPREPGTLLCSVTSAEGQQSFVVPESAEATSRVISGDLSSPAVYTASGALGCADEPQDCPGWIVTSWFWAECPNQAPECEHAARIHVRFHVEGAGSMAAMASSPPDEAFDASPEAFAEVVTIAEGGAP